MRTFVAAPSVATTRSNLLSAARPINVPGERWNVEGITYLPHRYDGGESFDPSCLALPELQLEDGAGPMDAVSWDVAAIYWPESCPNIIPAEIADLRRRAAAGLEDHRSDLIENLLWTNEVDGSDFATSGAGHPNVGLANAAATTLGGGAVGVVPAMSLLLEALADSLHGVRGMIHVPLEALPYLDFYGQVTTAGNQLLAGSSDHLVVAGSGYPGTSPAGAIPGAGFTWFYATSQVDVRLGPIDIFDPVVDRLSNTAIARAIQAVIVSWDRQAHFAVQVCLPDPGPECGAASS